MTESLQNIISRLEKLEEAVFTHKPNPDGAVIVSHKKFSGPKGGILMLIEENFFQTPQPVSDVKSSLEKNGYHYSIQAVQTALNRLSNLKGPLNTLKSGKKKTYVKRK